MPSSNLAETGPVFYIAYYPLAKVYSHCPWECRQASSQGVEVGVRWVRHSVLGVAHGLQGFVREESPWLMSRLLIKPTKSISRICVSFMSYEPWLRCPQLLPTAQSCGSPQYSSSVDLLSNFCSCGMLKLLCWTTKLPQSHSHL